MMDTAGSPAFAYDFSHNVDPYLQYTPSSSPYGISPISQTSPRLSFNTLNLSSSAGLQDYGFHASPTSAHPSFPGRISSPAPRPFSDIAPGLTLPSSGDEGRRSRTNSPPAGANTHGGLVHRNPLRYSSSSGTSTSGRPKRGAAARNFKDRDTGSDDDEDDTEFQPTQASDVLIQKRREEIRRQRIESEQRRRDELRDGYRRLKDVLPSSNQKSSKVSLLDRATTHIRYLEATQAQLQSRLAAAEAETSRLRQVNETLMLSAAEHRSAGSAPSY